MSKLDFRPIRMSSGLCRCLVLSVVAPVLVRAQPLQHDRFADRFRRGAGEVQERVDELFHDACEDIGRMVRKVSKEGRPVGGSSVDVRAVSDGYLIRVHMPGRDVSRTRVSVGEGGRLRIESPDGGGMVRHEQTLVLAGAAAGARASTEVDAARCLLVIKVPGSPALPSEAEGARSAEADKAWARQTLRRMERMRRDMERTMRQRIGCLGDGGTFFGSMVDIKEEQDMYVVRLVAPETDPKLVRVSVEGRDLRIDLFAEEGGKGRRGRGHMTQFVVLPGAVEADKMTIERGGGRIEVRLPEVVAAP